MYVCKKSYRLVLQFLKYIYQRTSYFGESDDPVDKVFEKKVLHRCLSLILSTKFRKAALKERS